jgi:NAD(P)-dependent dehydrogenase (short-subunit alcohol dehydrogenase family)
MSVNEFDLSGRVALVTGGSRGLGQIFAGALAEAGADIIITSRNLESLDDFCKEIESKGRRCLPLACDVRDYDSIQAMVVAA